MGYDIMRILYFIILIPLNWWSFRWLWNLVYISAGKTKQEVLEYRTEVRFSKHSQLYLTNWLIHNSPNPRKTKKLILVCNFGIAPAVVSLPVAVMGLFIPAFDGILNFAGIIVPVIIGIAAIAGVVCHKKAEQNSDGNTYKNSSVFGDGKILLNEIRKEEVERFEAIHKGSRAKIYTIGFLKLALLIGFMIGCVVLILNLTNQPKTPATVDQVQKALVYQGIQPFDMTEKYREAWDAGTNLSNAIVAEKDDIRFDFFIFDSDKRAGNIGSQYISKIQNDYPEIESQFKESNANYGIFSATAEGKYLVVACVNNTMVYAYCNKENKAVIRTIMIKIGYFKE